MPFVNFGSVRKRKDWVPPPNWNEAEARPMTDEEINPPPPPPLGAGFRGLMDLLIYGIGG